MTILCRPFYLIPLILVEMKKFLLLFIAACFSLLASAQKVYFLYFQTEDQTPFYVRMGEKIYSSAASGFLILSNLTDTTYYLNIGFAKSTEPETKFSVAINGGDRGFLLKKFEDGLALFDFEDLSVVKANEVQKDNIVYETKSDTFSNVLSKAAGDPSIIRVPVAKKEEEKPKLEEKQEVTVKTEEKKPVENPITQDSSTTQKETTSLETKPVSDSTVVKNETKPDTTAQQQPKISDTLVAQQPQLNKEESATPPTLYKPSVVTRHSESSTTEGFGIVYFDKSDEATDTVRILIPASKVKLETATDTTSLVNTEAKPKTDSLTEPTRKEISNKENEPQPLAPTANKTTCKSTATEKDFLKLRKRMAAEETDEAMIDEAKKDFKNKCYTVEQIRYLSTLFLTSAAKYQFFDAAYEHVSDKGSFASLGAEIKDEYYAKRFKALIGE